MEAKVETNRKKMTGVVVKDKMDKTIVIEVEKFLKHPKYHKYLKTKNATRPTTRRTNAVLAIGCLSLSRGP